MDLADTLVEPDWFVNSIEDTIMRKLLLATAVLLVSVTAYAADPSVPTAPNDPPQAKPAETAAEPAKVAEPAKPVESTKVAEPAKPVESTKVAEPAKAAEPAPVQASKPKQRAKLRESDEHKARRIAAKYGVYW
jgi:hypothetical protein